MPTPNKGATNSWFILGREPLLSLAELLALHGEGGASPIFFNPPLLRLKGAADPNLMDRLGGTIKIGTEQADQLSETDLLSQMRLRLMELPDKITFGISVYPEKNDFMRLVETWGKELKKSLKADGRSVRYVFKNEPALSSASVEKNKLITAGKEFLVWKNGDRYALAETAAVQPFENFSHRDYGRPGRDDVSGMLPPKLAMMLVNLAKISTGETILDPFCGGGTILGEAVLLGYRNVIGTDLSSKAVADAKQNLAWLTEQYSEKFSAAKWQLDEADVTKLSDHISPKSVGAIITEPYLGKPKTGRENQAELTAEASTLANLYLNAFVEFKKILRPGGRVVMVIPQFYHRDGVVKLSDLLLTKISSLGFKTEPLLPKERRTEPFLLYRRPDQHVGREIWRFKI